MSLTEGAKQLPLRHISIRVPWNDTGWNGCVCEKPAENTSCLILPRIREKRDDKLEETLSGKSWEELDEVELPTCVNERGGFMAPYDIGRVITHPYSKTSKPHKHLLPTSFRYPPFSAACIPFNWTLKKGAMEKCKALDLGFRPELEDKAHKAMGFETDWIQTKYNQHVLLDTFFSAIQPERSLCFFYAKRIPLVDETRRVIIGVGWVKHVGKPVEYRYRETGPFESILWERAVQHSIRPKFSDGFILPYHDVLKYLENNPNEDASQFVAFAPDEHFWSFSYVSEHLTNDGGIASLLSCAKALKNIIRVIPGRWNSVLKWINERLNDLWRMRGPYPGMGAVLTAFGIPKGTLLAYELERWQENDDNTNAWEIVEALLQNPDNQPRRLRQFISPTLCRKWVALSEERKALLKLLSRFELTIEQATCYYVHEDKRRDCLRVDFKDSDLLSNPYLLFENDRTAPDPIFLNIVDRGVFPEDHIRAQYPLPEPSGTDDATDERRVRAFTMQQLEVASTQGHTLLPRRLVIQQIRELGIEPQCQVDSDLMTVIEDSFLGVINKTEMADGEPAYQLNRLQEMDKIIRNTVQKRAKGRRHTANIEWRLKLDNIFGGKAPANDEQEQNARTEKTAALDELFASRISVLIGPAGTGKTTLLKVLCQEPEVKKGGIRALAPTGKARVRLEQQTGIRGAQTIAQFLLPIDRYDPLTGQYHLSNRERTKDAKTVIIDEASMLSEEQLAAILNALSGVQRLILVGDPRQLPPIGSGRPFLDIVKELEPENVESLFPRIGPGYTELTVRRRQIGESRDDLLLAEWFSGRVVDPGADEIWSRITEDNTSEHLRFVRWKDADELNDKLIDTFVEELNLDGPLDAVKFESSLGGSQYKDGSVFFWAGRKPGEPGACAKVEDWQILSPVRNASHGVEAVNRLIQFTYRSETKDWATSWRRKIPKPMGREAILYGDKVINLKNKFRKDVWPKETALKYVANGEIGIVVGQYKTKNARYEGAPWKMEVEFASQPGFKYGYGGRDFAEEAEPQLELAYALTIHKVQGSEFGLAFLIIPNPCWLLSRELLYTALTRQKNRVIIFHQGERYELMKYSIDKFSDAASRLTNLFRAPNLVQLEDRFLEDRLVHRTRRGDSVRSKSEVIIADLLYSKGIDYQYEAQLVGKDESVRYPDFTFEDEDVGLKFYWEHLGMLSDPVYRRRWENKLIWYREQDILPFDEGGGPDGTLIITRDDERGGIQSDEIEQLLDEVCDV